MKLILIYSFLFFAFLLTNGCHEHPTPKPYGYLRTVLPPDHTYTLSPENLPFTLQLSTYATWKGLAPRINSRPDIQWFNIHYKTYDATIHLSYIPINNNLDSLIEEGHKFAYEHTIKADAIDETEFKFVTKKVYGTLFDLKGNTASNMEFWATDSTQHFLRGALYFNTTPNVDSLLPIIDYIKVDVKHIINTLDWSWH